MTKSKNKPMTMEEEYRNADVPMPNDMLNASNTEQFKNDSVEKDDRGELDLTKIIDLQTKEIRDLVDYRSTNQRNKRLGS